MIPVTIPPIAMPRPPYALGFFLIYERARKPVIRAAGDSSMPDEQHQPIVTLAMPSPSETTASV